MKYKFILLLIVVSAQRVFGQLNPVQSSYFQNQYLSNPALIGEFERININAALRTQWTKTEGAPLTQAFSFDYGVSERVGLGFSIQNEKAGVLQRTRLNTSYAYRLPVDDDGNEINFGIAGGVFYEGFDFSKYKGDQNDITIGNYNRRPVYLDMDFGIAFRTKSLLIQGSIPNLKRFFDRDAIRNTVNGATFYSAISYKFINDFNNLNNGGIDYVEPMLVYRGVSNSKGILDAGVNIRLNEGDFFVSTMYHTSKSITFGIGTIFNKKFMLSGYYSNSTAKVQSAINGQFEIAIKYSIFPRSSESIYNNVTYW